MRSTKESKNKMGKAIYLGLYFSIIMIILLNSASAVQFWKYDGLRLDNNVSTYKWGVVTYDTFEGSPEIFASSPSWWNYILLPFGLFDAFGVIDSIVPNYDTDAIESGKPLEVYVAYNIYPAYWNSVNVNNTISSCSFAIKYSRFNTNGSTTIYQQNFTTDIANAKYFVKLQKGDTFYVDEQCFFNSPSQRVLQIPADFTIVAPTWNCQACQYYEWLSDQVRLTKAVTLSNYSQDILGYMKNIVLIFYEFFIYAWWFFLILLLLFSVSLIFIGIYWLYNFLMRHTK